MQPTFGQLLAEGMRRKGLDYRTLGKLVGVSHGYLWQIVNAEKRALNDPSAKRKRPSEAVTRQLASALELDELALLEAAGYSDAERNPLASSPVRYAAYTPPEDLFRDGIEASAKGQPDRAVALLQAALERGGVSFVNAHAGLGMAHFQAERFAQAIAEFDAAISAHHAKPEAASISAADLYYNRGLAYQRLARQEEGAAQRLSRRAARRDFLNAIHAKGQSQDLYHSALCYLLLEAGHPARVLPFGRSFLARQALQPRYTTAALDVPLLMAYAHSALGRAANGFELADLAIQLCPTYWYGHFVRAALYAQRQGATARQRAADLEAGLTHLRHAAALNPQSRDYLRAERDGDFRAWADVEAFRALL